MMLNSELRKTMQTHQTEVIAAILETSTHPRGALLAYLALEGFKFLDFLDFHKWSAEERSQIMQEIDWLVEQIPAATVPQERGND